MKSEIASENSFASLREDWRACKLLNLIAGSKHRGKPESRRDGEEKTENGLQLFSSWSKTIPTNSSIAC